MRLFILMSQKQLVLTSRMLRYSQKNSQRKKKLKLKLLRISRENNPLLKIQRKRMKNQLKRSLIKQRKREKIRRIKNENRKKNGIHQMKIPDSLELMKIFTRNLALSLAMWELSRELSHLISNQQLLVKMKSKRRKFKRLLEILQSDYLSVMPYAKKTLMI